VGLLAQAREAEQRGLESLRRLLAGINELAPDPGASRANGGSGRVEPEIVEMERMLIVGCEENGPDIGALWKRFMAAEDSVKNKVAGTGYELHLHPEGEHEWSDVTVMVGVQVTEAEDVAEGMVLRRLPASRYAVFTHRVADGGYEGANEQMDAWVEGSAYRLSPRMSIQRYDERFKGSTHPESEIDFLLPIVPRE
jgi:AraC family transcriptional regulator